MAAARPDQLYVRNQPVKDGVARSGDTYVTQAELERLLRPQDLNRITFAPPNVLVDEKVVGQLLSGEPPRIPLLAVAVALGYSKRTNPSLGFTDLVSAEAQEERKPVEKHPGGADWQRAQAMMQRSLAQDGGEWNAPEQRARLQRLGDLLSEKTESPGLQWCFYLSNQSEPNAYCTGVGALCVSRGLLELNLTDDELAGTMAHEMGHGMCRHIENARFRAGQMDSLEGGMGQARAQQAALQSKLRTLLSRRASLESAYRRAQAYYQQTGDSSLLNDAQQDLEAVTRQINDLQTQIARLETALQQMAKSWKDKDYRNNSKLWNQGDELDADMRGIRYAAAAGYNPEGLLTTLIKMRKANIDRFGYWNLGVDGQGDHPSVTTRIQIVEKVLTDWRRGGR